MHEFELSQPEALVQAVFNRKVAQLHATLVAYNRYTHAESVTGAVEGTAEQVAETVQNQPTTPPMEVVQPPVAQTVAQSVAPPVAKTA
jgi:hypothetical protein